MSNTNTFELEFLRLNELHENSIIFMKSENTPNFYAIQSNTWYNLNLSNGDVRVNTKTSINFHSKRLVHVFSIGEHQDLLMTVGPKGIRMFLCQNNDIMNVNEGAYFLDSAWIDGKSNMIFGRFSFDTSKMGALLIQPSHNNIKFFEVQNFDNNFAIKEVNTNTEVLNEFCQNNRTQITIFRTQRIPKEMLLKRDESNGYWCIFEIDSQSRLRFFEKIIVSPPQHQKEKQKLFLANLSGNIYLNDLIYLNSSGMFVFEYQYESSKLSSFKLLKYDPMFSAEFGWTDEHIKTIQIADIDNNDFDDLIFTGPAGIDILSFDLYINEWKSLLNSKDLFAVERHATVVQVLPCYQGRAPHTKLLTYHSGANYLANVIQEPIDTIVENSTNNFLYQININTSSIVPRIDRRLQHKVSPSIIYLRDQSIWFGKWDTINPQTGRPLFVLPLVGDTESMIKFHLFYDGSRNVHESLGFGWSMTQNFIIQNNLSGNLPNEPGYTIVLDSIPYQLTPISTNSMGYSLFAFELVEKIGSTSKLTKIQVKYNSKGNTWYADNIMGRKQFYGSVFDRYGATLTVISKSNWQDQESNNERPYIWYLGILEDASVSNSYEYDVIRKEIPQQNISFAAEAHLSNIRNRMNELKFFYGNNSLLFGYNYNTKTSNQVINFTYSFIDDYALLTGIEQQNDYIGQPVVQFKYCKPKVGMKYQILEKIILPTKTEIIYNYTLVGETISIANKDQEIINYGKILSISEDYNINFGIDFVLISNTNRNSQFCHLNLRMFNSDLSMEIFLLNETKWPLIGRNVDAHEILMGESFFAVIAYDSLRKILCLFGRKEDDSWISGHCSEYSEESTILKGNSFILISDPYSFSVSIFEWFRFKSTWETTYISTQSSHLRSIAVDGDQFLIYDDANIFAYKKNEANKTWIFKELDSSIGCLSKTMDTIDKFDLELKFRKTLFSFFRNNNIQLSNNLIVLSSLEIQNNTATFVPNAVDLKLVTVLRTFVLSKSQQIINKNFLIVNQDILSEIHSKNENDAEFGTYTMKYSYENDKFQIILGNVTGNLNEISRKSFNERIINKMNSPAKRFLLDIENYYVSLRDRVIECRNNSIIFDGMEWHILQDMKKKGNDTFTSLILDDNFTLNKTNSESTIKLYNRSYRTMLFDFEVKDIQDLQINYPNYIASQDSRTDGEPIRLVEFFERKFRNVTLSSKNSQKLSPFSNAPYLIIDEKVSERKEKNIFIWPKFHIRRFLPNYVASTVQINIPGITGGSKTRITGFNYSDTSTELIIDNIYYDRLTVVPGNDLRSYGYFTITANFVEYFNGEKELIKRIDKKNEGEMQTEEFHRPPHEDLIFYRFGERCEIANFAPFPLNSNMNDFIGFEDYEDWTFKKKWSFKEDEIIKGGFSLTGKNYLHLQSTATRRRFRPGYQDHQFLASCWIRTLMDQIPMPGVIVPYLTAKVLSNEGRVILNFMADAKYQIGDWTYLEVIIDLELVHLTLKIANSSFISEYLEIEIQVSPLRNAPIDVDHIRFSSVKNIFEAKVYEDDETCLPNAIIKPNGAIVRKLYDKYRVQIAEINESNQIERFHTYSKGSYDIERVHKNPSCVVTITPVIGFYDNFSPFSFRTNWHLTKMSAWNIAPGILQHRNRHADYMLLNSNLVDENSNGIRFLYSLQTNSLIRIYNCLEMRFSDNKYEIFLLNDNTSTKQAIHNQGELLLLNQNSRIIVWIDGWIYIDQYSSCSKSIEFVIKGDVSIQHMMIFNRPQVQVTYKNALNEDIQHISLKLAYSAVIRQMLYDELGRQRISTEPFSSFRVQKESLMSYFADIVINDDPAEPDSIWKTGIMKGVRGRNFAFTEIVYDNSPLSIRIGIGRPGKEFSTKGLYARRFKTKISNSLLIKLYPLDKNYSYEVEMKPFESDDSEENISIFDGNNRIVASYIHVKGDYDSFSTFDYNERGLMIKCRPPLYYLRIGIFDSNFEVSKILEQHRLETSIEYDARGNLIRKITPDAGPFENIYDDAGRIQFIVQYSLVRPKSFDSVTYFAYDTMGRLYSTGNLRYYPERDKLKNFIVDDENSNEFQHFYYSNIEHDPSLRGNILRISTKNAQHHMVLHEELIFNSNLISKRYMIPHDGDGETIVWSINKKFENGLLKKIIYPVTMFDEVFQIAYKYDKLGRMVFVDIPKQRKRILFVTYDASNRVLAEVWAPAEKFQFDRFYKYNEPGYLTNIIDPYLSEEISYTDKGYGRDGYGDGTITRVKFTAKWHKFSNIGNQIGVHSDSFQNEFISLLQSQECYHELKKRYLNADNRQTRIFYQNLDPFLSFACTNGTMDKRVKQVLGQYGFPEEYGFRFDYSRHNLELKKAKYFVGNISEEAEAFRSDSFARKIEKINSRDSEKIWNLLKSRGYIIEENNSYVIFGKSLIRESLAEDLKSIDAKLEIFLPSITKLLIRQFTLREMDIPLDYLQNILVPGMPNTTASAIHDILLRGDYFRNPISPDFVVNLQNLTDYLPEIVDLIQQHLGWSERTEFDMESENIDLNGNRISFYDGFDNYKLHYENYSNRINYIHHSNSVENVKNEMNEFEIAHDDSGNVYRALHLGIHSMAYHPVSNRVTQVLMTNGNSITFSYDSKGERFFKRVTNSEGKIQFETHYLRDELGRTLVERNQTYVAENQDPHILVTMYIYGPRSLIGFVRCDQFYNVLTDHQGSVRLVVRDGEIVAAYDYMPYGKLMRIYESTPMARIYYLYTGQEFDPETGLYNYHSRFYDPSIGRFYQIDPILQYFSPYKYAANSPISMVDPRGSLSYIFFLAAFGFALLCAYIAGAEINDDYDLLKWDWSNKRIYLALMKGALTGVFIPIGLKASPIVLASLGINGISTAKLSASIGVTISYWTVASKSGEWNPKQWDYKSPKTLNNALVSFSNGINIFSFKYLPFSKAIRAANNAKYILSISMEKEADVQKSQVFDSLSNSLSIHNINFRTDFKYYHQMIINNNNDYRVNGLLLSDNSIPIDLFKKLDPIFRDRYFNLISMAMLKANAMSSAIVSPLNNTNGKVSKITLALANEIANILKGSDSSEDDRMQELFSLQTVSFNFRDATLVYVANQLTNPFYFDKNHHKFLNTSIDSQLKDQIICDSTNREKMAIKTNFLLRQFLRWKFSQNSFSTLCLDRHNISKCKMAIDILFPTNHQISFSRNYITTTLNAMHFRNEKSDYMRHVYGRKEKRYESIAKKLQLKENNSNFTHRNKLLHQSKYLKISINNLKFKERIEIERLTKTLGDIIWNVIQEYSYRWEPHYSNDLMLTNFSCYTNAVNIKYSKSIPNPFDSTRDLVTFSSFKVDDIADLTLFQNCYTCVKTTFRTLAKVRNITWPTAFNGNIDRYVPNVFERIGKVLAKLNLKKRRSIGSGYEEGLFTNRQNVFGDGSKKNLKAVRNTWPNEPTNDFSSNLIDFGDKLFSGMANNETFFLMELLAAKCGKFKLMHRSSAYATNDDGLRIQKQVFVCNVIELYEMSVKDAAAAVGIKESQLDFSELPDLYQKIFQLTLSNKFDKIFDSLMESALRVLPQSLASSLRKQRRFMHHFHQINIKSKIDKILIKTNGFL